jgi:hypothetical protein
MKKFLIVFVLAIVLSSCSQVRFLHTMYGNEGSWNVVSKKDVPVEVIKTFETKYPDNTSAKWMKPNKNHYAVSFMKNGKITLAIISVSGILQDEEDYELDDYYLDEEFDDYWDFGVYD